MTMVCGKHRITHCALCTWRDVNPAPPEVPAPDTTTADGGQRTEGDYREVPAPDEVFVIVNSDAAPYDVYGDKANADECVIHCGGSVVRYVRAREGGR